MPQGTLKYQSILTNNPYSICNWTGSHKIFYLFSEYGDKKAPIIFSCISTLTSKISLQRTFHCSPEFKLSNLPHCSKIRSWKYCTFYFPTSLLFFHSSSDWFPFLSGPKITCLPVLGGSSEQTIIQVSVIS